MANLILATNFAVNGLNDIRKYMFKCRADQFTIVDGALRTFQEGDKQCPEADGTTRRGRTRAVFGNAGVFDYYQNNWFGWRMFIPNNFPMNNLCALASVKAVGSSASPRLAINNGVLNCTMYTGSVVNIGTIIPPKGRWFRIVMHVRQSEFSDGDIRVWLDDHQWVNKQGVNSRPKGYSPEFSVGCYIGLVTYPAGHDFETFWKDIRVARGTATDGYSTVDPASYDGGGSPDPEAEPPPPVEGERFFLDFFTGAAGPIEGRSPDQTGTGVWANATDYATTGTDELARTSTATNIARVTVTPPHPDYMTQVRGSLGTVESGIRRLSAVTRASAGFGGYEARLQGGIEKLMVYRNGVRMIEAAVAGLSYTALYEVRCSTRNINNTVEVTASLHQLPDLIASVKWVDNLAGRVTAANHPGVFLGFDGRVRYAEAKLLQRSLLNPPKPPKPPRR